MRAGPACECLQHAGLYGTDRSDWPRAGHVLHDRVRTSSAMRPKYASALLFHRGGGKCRAKRPQRTLRWSRQSRAVPPPGGGLRWHATALRDLLIQPAEGTGPGAVMHR